MVIYWRDFLVAGGMRWARKMAMRRVGMAFKRRVRAWGAFWVLGGVLVWVEWYWWIVDVSRHVRPIKPHKTP